MTAPYRTLASDETRGRIVLEWAVLAGIIAVGAHVTRDILASNRAGGAPWWGWALVAFFAVLVLLLFYRTGRKTLDRLRYGPLTLQLDAPVRLGGRLAGTLALAAPANLGELQLTLECETSIWAPDTYKESNVERTSRIAWSGSSTAAADAQGRVRVSLAVPGNQPRSDFPGSFGKSKAVTHGRLYVRWLLRVKGEGSGVNLDRTIEIPVLEVSQADPDAPPASSMPAASPGMSTPVQRAAPADAHPPSPDFLLPSACKQPVVDPQPPRKNVALRFALLLLPLIVAIGIVVWQWRPSVSLPRVSLPGWAKAWIAPGGESEVKPGAQPEASSAFEPPRRATLRPSHVIDLDTAQANKIDGADLWWHFLTRTDRQIDARSGADFAVVDNEDAFRALDERRITALDYAHRSLPAQGGRVRWLRRGGCLRFAPAKAATRGCVCMASTRHRRTGCRSNGRCCARHRAPWRRRRHKKRQPRLLPRLHPRATGAA